MFKELGYSKVSIGSAIIYTHNKTANIISFFFQHKEVMFQHYLDNSEIEFQRAYQLLKTAELKAMVVQLYELGWV